MKESWRWYGPKDPVSLSDIKQAGATDIVTALHHIPNGVIWPVEDILKRKNTIESVGLKWTVVESIPVHENIKTRTGNYQEYIKNYQKSIQNLASCGIHIVCYNFMPVLDWTRTSLDFELEDGSKALRFDMVSFIAFDVFILKRPNAKSAYSDEQLRSAEVYFDKSSKKERVKLTNTIIAGLPGAEKGYTLEDFQAILNTYASIDSNKLKENLVAFLKEIVPIAEDYKVLLCIHPDDPPFSILGLPRVVSTGEDYEYIFNQVPNICNGITFCTGSLGVLPENNLVELFKKLANRVHFIHLRSTKRDKHGNFYEANHLEGDVDMHGIIKEILLEEKRRKINGQTNIAIPMRPDHGHQMLDDLHKRTNPGYSAIGRLRGLAELRGLTFGIAKHLSL
ncbi:MAG: mannonate dehydratase [Cellulophaga sp.]